MLATWMATLAQTYTYTSTNSGDVGGTIIGGGFFCCFAIFGILLFVFWLWMLIDCITREFPGPNDKLAWVLVVVLLGFIGAAIYYFVGRPRGTKT